MNRIVQGRGIPTDKHGPAVEVIVFLQPLILQQRTRLAVGQLRRSGLIGMWQNCEDICDSSVCARTLREQAQKREGMQANALREFAARRGSWHNAHLVTRVRKSPPLVLSVNGLPPALCRRYKD